MHLKQVADETDAGKFPLQTLRTTLELRTRQSPIWSFSIQEKYQPKHSKDNQRFVRREEGSRNHRYITALEISNSRMAVDDVISSMSITVKSTLHEAEHNDLPVDPMREPVRYYMEPMETSLDPHL